MTQLTKEVRNWASKKVPTPFHVREAAEGEVKTRFHPQNLNDTTKTSLKWVPRGNAPWRVPRPEPLVQVGRTMHTLALANAKFILSGEHFVVDGTHSVVIPAPCFTTQVSLIDQSEPQLRASCIFECESSHTMTGQELEKHQNHVLMLVKKAADLLDLDLTGTGLRCVVKSNLPPGQGAGSSSALCQAIVEALMKHFITSDVHPNYLKWFGTQLENTWHGPVSGIDNTAIAYQRMMLYQRGQRPEPIVPGVPMFFVVGSTGPRTDKISPYAAIRRLRESRPLEYSALKLAMDDNAKELAGAIQSGHVPLVGSLMSASHQIFKQIGISTTAIELAIQRAEMLGAYGARMTGAGAGGFVIACVPVHIVDKLQMAWQEMGLRNIRTLQFDSSAVG